MQEKQFVLDMPAGGSIALHRLKPNNPIGLPIIIAHGTMSNADTVRDLGQHLCELGFDCWLLDWGGHGESRAKSSGQNFEFPAFNDVPLAIETVLKTTGHQKVYWVSHSGGGHLAFMHLARNPAFQDQMAGIVTLGAQATDGALGFKFKTRALILWGITQCCGCFPKSMASMGTEGEPTHLLAQWSRWNISKKWHGVDGFDYMLGLEALTLPALIMAGGDDDIAPQSGCEKLFTALGSTDKSYQVFSKANGFSKDFTHGQMIRGGAAKREVFVLIGDWLLQRNNHRQLNKMP